jgi:ADP-heptose:LPS heptosyltransferase
MTGMKSASSYLKFFIKIHVVGSVRGLLLQLLGSAANEHGWEKRMLIVHLEGLGDIAMLIGVLKHYKEDFPDKEIYLLAPAAIGADVALFDGVVDRLEVVDYKAFIKNPWYGFSKINALRKIGFQAAITHDPGVSELVGKQIVLGIGAKEMIGYEGMLIQEQLPLNPNMALSVSYAKKSLFPRYTKLIPSIDRGHDLKKRLPCSLRHYIASYEAAFEKRHDDYAPILSVPRSADEKMLKILNAQGIASGSYCLLTLATSTPHREWGPEKFAEALRSISSFNLPLVVAGGQRDRELAARFARAYQKVFLNLAGETTIPEYVALISRSLFSFSNDTAPTHIAVALKKPSVSILGLGHFGMNALYGYADINRWVYREDADCLCDNWRCIYRVGPEDPTPCIAGIGVDAVSKTLSELVAYLRKGHHYPVKKFEVEFRSQM